MTFPSLIARIGATLLALSPTAPWAQEVNPTEPDASAESTLNGAPSQSPHLAPLNERLTRVANTIADGVHRAVELGAHHRVWQALTQIVDDSGNPTVVTNSYTELATGANVWSDSENKWIDASDEIEVLEDRAVSTRTQHRVSFAGDLLDANGTVDLLTPDQKRMRSRVVGLAYTESDTGRSVFIAEVKDTSGVVVGRNQVVYLSAFDSINCDIRYTVTIGGLEQDVIVREALPSPIQYGLNPDRTRLEVWTEFLESPQAIKSNRTLMRPGGPSESDNDLDFGSTLIGPGRAFSLNLDDPVDRALLVGLPVAKAFEVIGDQSFLIESVPYSGVKEDLDKLPRPQGALLPGRNQPLPDLTPAQTGRRLRPVSIARAAEPPMRRNSRMVALAALPRDRRAGLVLDYPLAVVSQSGLTLEGDKTYYVSSVVTLSGTTTLEGGAVVKFAQAVGDSPKILLAGPLVCKTSAYRPAIFTARDDNTVGETVSDSTGTPAGYYGWWMLGFTGPYAYDARNVNFRFGLVPVYYLGNPGQNLIRHAQFHKCYAPLYVDNATLKAQNVLVHDSDSAITVRYGAVFNGEHVTVNKAVLCPYLPSGQGHGTVSLVNSLRVEVSNPNTFPPTPNTVPPSSFTPSSSPLLASAADEFTTVGAGGSYLKDNTHRNQGLTTIDPQLAADLKLRTTYPPTLIAANSTITMDTVLTPVVQRDSDIPDLAYHYDPLDYLASQVTVQNATLSLANGVAIGTYGTRGFYLGTGGKLVSHGLPTQPNRLGHLRRVQEQPSTAWSGVDQAWLSFSSGGPPKPSLRLIHTDLSVFGTAYDRHLAVNANAYESTEIFIQDCYLRGPLVDFYNASVANALNVTLRNNLCERIDFNHNQNGTTYKNFALEQRNNTFVGGVLRYTYGSAGVAWTVKDNLFDNASFVKSITASSFNASHNAYRSGLSTLIQNEPDAITVSTMDYQVGPVATAWALPGHYYFPSSGGAGSLSSLVNEGSRTAEEAGLSYYTTFTGINVRDTGFVDIGFHYPATFHLGAFFDLDSDSDGIWDGGDHYPTVSAGWADPYAPPETTAPTITLLAPPNVSGAP